MKIVTDAVIAIAAIALIATGVGAVAGGVTLGTAFGFTAGAIGTLTGVTVSTELLAGVVAAGVLAEVSALMPKPSQGGSQTKWKADPYAGLPYVMGRTLVSGNIVGRRGSGGNNPYEHFVTVLSVAGPINAIEANFAARTTLDYPSNQGTPATGFYSGRLYQSSQLGTQPEAAALVPQIGAFPGWDSTCKLSGMAATLATMKYDASGSKTLSTEPQLSWILRGVAVYDPRLDSTYPGGSGACRAFDESTYIYSENPHLHGLTWTMGRYANGKRTIGIGATMAQIDVPSFVEGANLDDARGWKIGGQVVSRPDTPWNNLSTILQAGGSVPVMVGGIISCINQAPRVSLATITRSDIVGDCSFSGTQPRRTRINGVIPMYRSEEHDWEMVSASGVIVADYVALDGDERTKEIQFPLVQDVDQVSQLARYQVENSREAGPGTAPLKPWWLNYRTGDCITFFPDPDDDWSVKCLIMGRALDAQTGIVTVTLQTETDAKHAAALGQTGTAPPNASTSYDTDVDAPAPGSWTISGTSLSSSGGAVPAIVVGGAADNPSATRVVFEIRAHVAGQGDDDGWSSEGSDLPLLTRKTFTNVAPGTDYDVSVRYMVRGVLGARLILGPATAGALVASTAATATNADDAALLGGTYGAADITTILTKLNAAGIAGF